MGIGIEKEKLLETTGKKFALLMGVGEFRELNNLPGVGRDIENFGELLRDDKVSEFEVRYLVNPELNEGRKAIYEISSKAEAGDIILFYFSGHGTIKDDTFYLPFSDSELGYIEATCMDSEYILSQFRKSRCETFIIIIDTCYSGAFFNNNRGLPKSLVALTATGDKETAMDTKEGGAFTNIILKGLRSDFIDTDRNGEVTFSELFKYISRKIRAESYGYGKPKKWEWNVDKDIVLFKYPRPVFISYHNGQSELVKKISDSLETSLINTFYDKKNLLPGTIWEKGLEESIKNSRGFIFITDQRSIHSKYALIELQIAIDNNVPIFPIQIEELADSADFEKQYGKYHRQQFDCSNYDQCMEKLIEQIHLINIAEPNEENIVPARESMLNVER
jgi:hypothetical protein